MVSVVLAAEGRAFFRHVGMNFIALARAVYVDLKERGLRQDYFLLGTGPYDACPGHLVQ